MRKIPAEHTHARVCVREKNKCLYLSQVHTRVFQKIQNKGNVQGKAIIASFYYDIIKKMGWENVKIGLVSSDL